MQALRATSLPARAKSKDFVTPLQSCGALAFNKELNGANLPVMGARVMLGRVASKVGLAKGPVQIKLALFTAVLDPISVHIC